MLFTKKAPEDNQPITDTTDPFALYLGNAVCGAVVLDASLKIAQINTVLCEYLGLTPAAVIGTLFSKHIASADQAIWQELTAHSDASGSTAQIALLTANNKQIQGKLSLQAIPANQELLVTFENQHQLLQYATEIEYRKTHDELTGLNNRKALEAYLNKTFESQSLFSKPIAMIYINVDQLKVVNDTCGHIAGDELLKQLEIGRAHV